MTGGEKMKYKTFSEMNELLRTAANINPKSCNGKKIEDIATSIGISSQMLYKWRAGGNMSGEKVDLILKYFEEEEPQRLEIAERILGW
jgi:transposase-like protein